MNPNRKIKWKPLAMMAAALSASCLPSAMAGDTTSPTDAAPLHLTLAQAIGEALQANPGLRTAGHQAYAAADEASAVARSRLGGLNAVGSYSYLNDDQIIRPMSSELMVNGIAGAPWDRSQAHYGVNYELPLYLGGLLNNQIQIAKLEARKSAELLEGTRWQVRFNVVSLYSTVQALDQTETALDEQIAALTQTKTNLDEMVSLGKRPDVDRLKMIEDLEAAKASRTAAGADRRKVSALLLSVLGRDPAGDLTVEPQAGSAGFQPAVSPASSRQDVGTDGASESSQRGRIGNPRYSRLEVCATNSLPAAVTDNSIIRTARLSAEQAARGVKVARSEFLPKVYAGANYLENSGTTIGRNEETWGATVSVNLPLFEWGSRFSKLKAARSRQAAATEALRQTELETEAAWQDALAKFTAVQTNVDAAAARVAAGTEAARIEQVRYDTGAGTIEDLLRARSREEDARAALASANADLVISAERINTIAEKKILP
jgi:outer membrane protein TolC